MMDFGVAPDTKTKITHKSENRTKSEPSPKSNLKKHLLIISAISILVLVGIAIYLLEKPKNPLPVDIKSQISYNAVYPTAKTGSLTSSGYQFHADQKSLNFTVNSNGANIVFVEQPAPSTVGSGSQVYYQALGVHPYAQFQSKLGPVALAKFYQAGSLKAVGQSAILAAQGTLVIAHSENDLTNAQWKALFDSLKISK